MHNEITHFTPKKLTACTKNDFGQKELSIKNPTDGQGKKENRQN